MSSYHTMWLGRMHTRFVLDSKYVKPENLKFYKITQGAYLFGLVGHFGAIFMFYGLGVPEMVWFNTCLSVPAFTFAFLLNRRGKHSLGFLFAFLELLFHQVATTYFTGWGFGAHYWLIYLAALSFFNTEWKLRTHLILLAIVLAAYVLIFLNFQTGIYAFDIQTQRGSTLNNATTVLVVLSLLIYYYASSAWQAEQKLMAEKALTTKMLKRIEGLFGQQVSEEIALQMIESEQEIESRAYDATIMFLDIRDFTVFADTKAPSEIAKFQNIVFGNLIEIIQSHQGVVLQLLGDGLMAVFGAPTEDPRHPEHAYQASLAILDRIESLIKKGDIPQIKIGIGLNSGNIIAGNLGNDLRKAYSLTGKNVIIAARIESLNKRYQSQFLISKSVYQHLNSDKTNIQSLGDVHLKGIEQPVEIYQVV